MECRGVPWGYMGRHSVPWCICGMRPGVAMVAHSNSLAEFNSISYVAGHPLSYNADAMVCSLASAMALPKHSHGVLRWQCYGNAMGLHGVP